MKFYSKILSILIAVIFLCLVVVFSLEVGGYKKHYESARYYSKAVGVDLSLTLAVIKTESNFDKNATSNKGAVGLMQLMPSTADFIAKKIGYFDDIDLFDEKVNIMLGVNYLKYLLDKFKSEEIALWAYNAGETRVKTWLDSGIKTPPIVQTENYAKRVIRRKKLYKILT